MTHSNPPNSSESSTTDANLADAPLLQLLGKPLDQLPPEELREHISQLRAVSSSPNTLRAHINADKEANKKARSTKTPAEPKQSAASLADKYKNFGKKK